MSLAANDSASYDACERPSWWNRALERYTATSVSPRDIARRRVELLRDGRVFVNLHTQITSSVSPWTYSLILQCSPRDMPSACDVWTWCAPHAAAGRVVQGRCRALLERSARPRDTAHDTVERRATLRSTREPRPVLGEPADTIPHPRDPPHPWLSCFYWFNIEVHVLPHEVAVSEALHVAWGALFEAMGEDIDDVRSMILDVDIFDDALDLPIMRRLEQELAPLKACCEQATREYAALCASDDALREVLRHRCGLSLREASSWLAPAASTVFDDSLMNILNI